MEIIVKRNIPEGHVLCKDSGGCCIFRDHKKCDLFRVELVCNRGNYLKCADCLEHSRIATAMNPNQRRQVTL